jgi:hypothetical protein
MFWYRMARLAILIVVGIFKGQDIHESEISNAKDLFAVVLFSQSNQYHWVLRSRVNAAGKCGCACRRG